MDKREEKYWELLDKLEDLEVDGPYEEFLKFYEEIQEYYKEDQEYMDRINKCIFATARLEFVLIRGEVRKRRDPEDAAKIIRWLLGKQRIDPKYLEKRHKRNLLQMFYHYTCKDWPPELVLETTKLLVENGVDASQEDKYGNAMVDELLLRSDYLASELEPTIAYLVEHGARFGGRNNRDVSFIEDCLKGERREDARRMREKYGNAKEE